MPQRWSKPVARASAHECRTRTLAPSPTPVPARDARTSTGSAYLVAGRSPAERDGRAWWRVLAFAAVPLLLIGLLAYGLLRTQAPKAVVGAVAPSFQLPRLGGQTLSSDQLRGKPLVLNFWASWCRPCREEAPTLERAWERYGAQGVQFLGVNVQDSPEDAMAFTREFWITYLSVRDRDLRLWTDLGMRGVPETFFIDHTWRFLAIGSGQQVGSQGATKVLGAISPSELKAQIELLLQRRQAGDRRQRDAR